MDVWKRKGVIDGGKFLRRWKGREGWGPDTNIVVVIGGMMERMRARAGGHLTACFQEYVCASSLLTDGAPCPLSMSSFPRVQSVAFPFFGLPFMAARPGTTVPVMGNLVEVWLSSLPGPPSPCVTRCLVGKPALTPQPAPWGGKLGDESLRSLTQALF